MTKLSWQPPVVTKCGECPYLGDIRVSQARDELRAGCASPLTGFTARFARYRENKNGITPTCPMWIEQNKEKAS